MVLVCGENKGLGSGVNQRHLYVVERDVTGAGGHVLMDYNQTPAGVVFNTQDPWEATHELRYGTTKCMQAGLGCRLVRDCQESPLQARCKVLRC